MTFGYALKSCAGQAAVDDYWKFWDYIPEIRKAIDTAEKILSDKGRVLVRYSGTQSLCRVMVEGQDEKKIKGFAQNLVQLIGNKLN